MTFRERLTKYKAQREIKLRGGLNCIPFSEFLPELSLFMPGIIKGVYYAITAFTNVGKTPLVNLSSFSSSSIRCTTVATYQKIPKKIFPIVLGIT